MLRAILNKILKATFHERVARRPPTSHLVNHPNKTNKCGHMLVAVLRGPWFLDYHMHLWLVGLSTPSVPTLYLKDPQMGGGDDTIYPELLMVGVVSRTKLPECWHLKEKLSVTNYLLRQSSNNNYREKLPLLLCLRSKQLRYLAGAVFLSYSIFWRLRLLMERFYSRVFGMDIGSLSSINPKNIYFL